MATSLKAIFFLASALCILSFIGIANVEAHDNFFVEGKVYCDNCRVQFVTRISKYMAGAKVRLECRHIEGGEPDYSVEGVTDESGTYSIKVEGDHEEDVCDISLAESSDPDCSEINEDSFLERTARISLAKDSGISSPVRLANPLGFMAKKRAPDCDEVMEELGFTSHGLV